MKKLLITLAIGCAGVVIATIVTYYKYEDELSNKLKLLQVKKIDLPVDGKDVRLEEGSSILMSDLEDYLLFSDKRVEVTDKDLIKKKGHQLLIRELELGPIEENTCELVYCMGHPLDFAEIPPLLWKGLIGVEDIRFIEHKGIDWRSILRAIIVDIKEMKLVQGGSTLTQQLVKNLFLTREKSLKRKFKELFYSISLEQKYSKDEIITMYFNSVFWGALQGIKIRGIKSASTFYFQKNINELNEYEVSILISLLKGPNFYHPIRRTERLKSRVDVIFSKLYELKMFSKLALKNKWSDEKWKSWVKELKDLEKRRPYRAIYKINDIKAVNLNDFEKIILLKSVEKIIARSKKRSELNDIAVKIIMGDPHCKNDCDQLNYYSKVERSLERAIFEEKHQIGSIIKPIIYSIYLNIDYSLEDKVSTEPIVLDLKSGKWGPNEASKIDEKEITIAYALLKSRNRPLIRLANEVGFDYIEDNLEGYIKEFNRPLSEYPSQLLGAVELSLNDTFKMYKRFLHKQCEQIAGNDEMENALTLLADPKKNTLSRAVDKRLSAMRFFGKTGTTNNGLDNWFVGHTGRELMIVWLGVEGDRRGVKAPLYGSSTSFKIYQEFQLRRGRQFQELLCVNNI